MAQTRTCLEREDAWTAFWVMIGAVLVLSIVGVGSLKARLDRRVPLDVGIELGQKGVQIIGIPGLDGALDALHVLPRHRLLPAAPRLRGLGSASRTRVR